MKKQEIKDLKISFRAYIKFLKDYSKTNQKAEVMDMIQEEEQLREDILSQLNNIKVNYF